MKIGFVQFKPIFGQIEKNVRKLVSMLSKTNANLIVLPELCTTGYVFGSRTALNKLAEKISSGFACSAFIKLAKEKNMYIVAGIAEREKNKLYNSAVLIGPNGVIHVYRKLHLFWSEKKWFDKGNIPLAVNSVKNVKIGMMICFDYIFPQVAQLLARKGMHILCHPSNLVLPYCQKVMIARCIENRVFTITANRIGKEKGVYFTGKSQIVDPYGNILAKASDDSETVKTVEIDPGLAENKNITPLNNLFSDARPVFYLK